MKRRADAGVGLVACLLLAVAWPQAVRGSDALTVLSYHDIVDQRDARPSDDVSVTTRQLVEQFEWMRAHGFTPVSLDDVIAQRAGVRPLPKRAVLLTFDDGYESFATRVLPLLEIYRYPALLALVGAWHEDGRLGIDGRPLLDRDQLREIAASPWVEIASHSFDLHRELVANPQGGSEPAAETRAYSLELRRYETADEQRSRIRFDLAASIAGIERLTGERPRALVWPYGAFSGELEDAARGVGFVVTLGLGAEQSESSWQRDPIPRFLVSRDQGLAGVVERLNGHLSTLPERAVHVDLALFDELDGEQVEERLGLLVDAVSAVHANAVYLRAYRDRDQDGRAEALYHVSALAPTAADLLNRVAWQLRTRARVRVWAELPPALETQNGTVCAPVSLAAEMAAMAPIAGLILEGDPRAACGAVGLADEVRRAARRWRGDLQVAARFAVSSLDGGLGAPGEGIDVVILALEPGAELPSPLRLSALDGLQAASVVVEVPSGDLALEHLRVLSRRGYTALAYGPLVSAAELATLPQLLPGLGALRAPPLPALQEVGR